jgi:hypothetical protein
MKNLIKIIFILFLSFVLFYTQMPVLRYGFYGIAIIILIISIVCLLAFTTLKFIDKGTKISLGDNPFPAWIKYVIYVSLFYLIILPFFTSSALIHTKKYQNLIGPVKNGKEISNQISPISLEEVRVVDKNLAYLVGEKVLGSQPALGSQVELGEFIIQEVNNKLVWVAPLEHSGFFKWLRNSEGTPGYVIVSVTNERDVKMVQTFQNKAIKIKFQQNAYFGDNLQRHIYSTDLVRLV